MDGFGVGGGVFGLFVFEGAAAAVVCFALFFGGGSGFGGGGGAIFAAGEGSYLSLISLV